ALRPGRRARPLPSADWIAAEHVLQQSEAALAARECFRRTGKSGRRRVAVRKYRYVSPLELDRRPSRRRARDRRDQRESNATPEFVNTGLGRKVARGV